MAVRIEVVTTVPDSRGIVRQKKLYAHNFVKVNGVTVVDVYTIDKQFSKNELKKIGEALTNPVTQRFEIKNKEERIKKKEEIFSWAVEIGYLPGVTDNVAHTTKEIIEDLLKVKFKNGEDVYTSQITFLSGTISEKQIREIASTLFNPVIQRAIIKSYGQFKKDRGMDIIVPQVKLNEKQKVDEVILHLSDEELVKIGKLGIQNSDGTRRGPLALDLSFMKSIRDYFVKKKRNPVDIELESIAQTWSEHCKHTIFANPLDDIADGLYKQYIKKETEEVRRKKGKNDMCVSVFTDNSGAIEFDDNYLITHKVETHNSPSTLDPFGGSITGIGGVNRDAMGFGLGAKPVANMYGFCFASPKENIDLYKDKALTQKMLSSTRIMEGVIDGVNAGGNQSGIPTPQGFMYFNERYRGKPLVFVGTVGLIPKKIHGKKSWVKRAQKGDYIVMVGGRVGKDGIHGATFSSEGLSTGSPATAVQIGDPITQKKMSDALIKEARDKLLYSSITDNGAGGLSCSVAEMAKESGGCLVDLEKVPLKYPGLAPWEIWISESQERMTLAVPKKKWKVLQELLNKRGVEATVIGEFTNSGKCIVRYHKKIIMDMDMDFLHDGAPMRKQESQKPSVISSERSEARNLKKNETSHSVRDDIGKTLLRMLSRRNITSYSFISSQYDSIVQAGSVLPPLQGRGRVNGEASIFRPVLSSQKGVILSQGMYPTYSEIDTYAMGSASLDTAVRNSVAAGANPEKIALLDNFCWCSPTDPERLYQLKEAARACYEIGKAYGMPFISGKDSMFNDFSGYDTFGAPLKISILPTLLISSISVIDDVTKAVSLDTKIPGDLVYILGETFDEISGSEYERMQNELSNFGVPKVNSKKNLKLYSSLHSAIQKRLIASSISVTRGGIGVALSKMAMGGMWGLSVTLQKIPGRVTRNDCALFSESQGRIVVTVAPQNKKQFESVLKGNSISLLGKVTDDKIFTIQGLNGKQIVQTSLQDLQTAYTKTFKDW